LGVGVEVSGHISRNNYDPHPARLRYASAGHPPHKGEGKTEFALALSLISPRRLPVTILATHTRSGNAIRVWKYKIGLEQGHIQVSNFNHIEPTQQHA
jgi:hypothetical protein